MTRFLVSSFSLLSKNRLIMCKPFLFLGRYSIICCAIIHYILPSECTTSSRATLTSFSFLSYSSSKLDDLPPFGVSAGDEFSYGVTTPYLPSLTRSISRNSANRSIFFRSTTEAMMLEGSNGVGDDDEEGRFLGGRGGRVCTSGVIDDLLSSSSATPIRIEKNATATTTKERRRHHHDLEATTCYYFLSSLPMLPRVSLSPRTSSPKLPLVSSAFSSVSPALSTSPRTPPPTPRVALNPP